MQQTQVWSLGQEDPLEKEMAIHSRTGLLPGKFQGWRSLVGYSPWGPKELDTTSLSRSLYWNPCCSRRKLRANNRLPCLLAPWESRRASLFLVGVRVGVCPLVRPEGWFRCSAHSWGNAVCRGLVQYPVCAQGSSDVAIGFLVSLYLWVQNLYHLHRTQLFVVPYSFFAFCCSKRVVSKSKYYRTVAKDPRSQPVSVWWEKTQKPKK